MLPMSAGRLSLSSLLTMAPPPSRAQSDLPISPKWDRRTAYYPDTKTKRATSLAGPYRAGIVLVGLCLVLTVALNLDLGTTAPVEPSTPSAQRVPHRALSRPRRARTKPLKFDQPTALFRDNLLDDHRYISIGHVFGFEQQQWQLIKAIQFARQVERTPILDHWHPENDPQAEADPVPRRVSDFFDLDGLQAELDTSILEWADVKSTVDPPREDIAGWAAFGPWQADESLRDEFNIRSHFWSIPPVLDYYPTFKTLELLSTRAPPDWIEGDGRRRFEMNWWDEVPDWPDEHVFHLDTIFFAREARIERGKVDPWESLDFIDTKSRAWNEVGQHLRFSSTLNALADKLAHEVLGVPGKGPFPFLAVHVTKADFKAKEHEHPYSLGIRAIQEKLVFERGLEFGSLPIIFTTDATNDKHFMRKLIKFGWKHLDHKALNTASRYGGWYPTLLNQVVLSRAVGFTGTWGNPTASLVARRVEAWQNGLARLI